MPVSRDGNRNIATFLEDCQKGGKESYHLIHCVVCKHLGFLKMNFGYKQEVQR